jgi:type IV pilus assembly protein PilO
MIRSFSRVRQVFGETGPRRKFGLALAALALFDLVFYLFAIGPLSQSDRERALLAEQLKRQVAERTAQVDKLAGTVSKVEKARTEGDKLLANITMPRRTAFSSIVSELDQAAKQAGVELKERGYNVEEIEGSATLSMMTVTVGLEGNYENLVQFLNQLDRSPRFLIIESLGAAPQQTGQQQQAAARLNISVKLDAFVREM